MVFHQDTLPAIQFRDRLQLPQDVAEPEADQANLPLLDGAEHVGLLVFHAPTFYELDGSAKFSGPS